jgi:DNA-binding transcriptional LysR family regulator
MDANIQKYMALINVVEQGSFSKAAEAMAYSQSGISRMIKDLEDEWGFTLVERGKRGVSLTSDGTAILPYVRRMVEDYKLLQRQTEEISGLEKGLIRIGTMSSVAQNLLPDIISRFQKDHPHIEFELMLGGYDEIRDWIKDGSADCGFLSLTASEGLDCTEVYRDEFKVILPENHPLAGVDSSLVAESSHQSVSDSISDDSVANDPFPVDKLTDDPFILIEKKGNTEISEMLAEKGIKTNTRFTTIDDYAAMSMVESGLGISILNGLVLARCPYRIVQKSMSDTAYRTIVFAVRDKDMCSRAVREFARFIN